MLLLVARGASAANTARLVYLQGAGTDQCPTEADLRDAVAARLGYDPFTPFSLDTLFTEIEKDGPKLVARVKLVTQGNQIRGARTLTTTGPCSDLVASLALTISIAIDPMAGTREGLPEGLPPREHTVEITEGDTTTTPIEPPPPREERPPPPTPPPVERVRFAIGAGLAALAGSSPSPTGGVLLFGTGRLGDASAILEARVDLPSSTSVGTGRVASWLVAGSILPCGHLRGIFACVKGTLGRLSAEGIDVEQPTQKNALWAEIGGRLGYELGLGASLALRVQGDVAGVLTRYPLRVGERTVFTYPAVAGGVGAALALALP
jgi:hypothetical protein